MRDRPVERVCVTLYPALDMRQEVMAETNLSRLI